MTIISVDLEQHKLATDEPDVHPVHGGLAVEQPPSCAVHEPASHRLPLRSGV